MWCILIIPAPLPCSNSLQDSPHPPHNFMPSFLPFFLISLRVELTLPVSTGAELPSRAQAAYWRPVVLRQGWVYTRPSAIHAWPCSGSHGCWWFMNATAMLMSRRSYCAWVSPWPQALTVFPNPLPQCGLGRNDITALFGLSTPKSFALCVWTTCETLHITIHGISDEGWELHSPVDIRISV